MAKIRYSSLYKSIMRGTKVMPAVSKRTGIMVKARDKGKKLI